MLCAKLSSVRLSAAYLALLLLIGGCTSVSNGTQGAGQKEQVAPVPAQAKEVAPDAFDERDAEKLPTKKLMPAPTEIRGVNLLQTKEVSLNNDLSDESFAALANTGANTVALVPFMHQAGFDALKVELGRAVTDKELIAGIRRAHAAGLKVILKPQILVDNSWAGLIDHKSADEWREWFSSYTTILLHYAKMAQVEEVEGFVVGTELKKSDKQPYWRDVIASVRRVYKGELTYAAHNLDGVKGFAHWDLLDFIGVTLYPPLGDSPKRSLMQAEINSVVAEIESVHARFNKDILVTEIGLPSAAGAQLTPWQLPLERTSVADAELQAEVLDLWLGVLHQPWIRGVLVWNWHSDPYAGGRFNTDFTVQNKPAQAVLKCHWVSGCTTGN